MVQALLTPGRRWRALRSLVFCAAVDLALIVVVAAVVALIVSPITQG